MYLKYNEIWNKIKELLGGLKFYSEPIYDDSYIKTKVKSISVDSVLKGDKKNYPKVYLEHCKYKVKKKRNEKLY